VDRQWRDSARECAIEDETVDHLAPLMLAENRQQLDAGDWEGYETLIETESQRLQPSGVSLEDAVIGVGLYGEACLATVGEPDSDLAWAVGRWIAVTGHLVVRAYANQKAAHWRRVDDRERQRLSRDLHDEVGHNLVVLKLYLEMIGSDLAGNADKATVGTKIQEATGLVGEAVESVRRLMLDLGPAVLEEVGLVRALRVYASDFTKRTRTRVRLRSRNVPENLPASLETALYRVYQGALSNVAKHSSAEHVEVQIVGRTRSVRMIIEDDGIGFDLRAAIARRTFGMTAMRERVELLGGTLEVDSRMRATGERGRGTTIVVVVPLQESSGGGAP
jgi:signal transduction histidine kinase